MNAIAPQGQLDLPILTSFSVIIPVYNLIQNRGEAVIRRTLGSVEASLAFFQQTYPHSQRVEFEIVVVDDGSSDRTLEVVEDYARGKSFYQLIKYPLNQGQAAARNTGVRFSRGQVLFFCDGDDLYRPEHLYTCFSVLNHPIPQAVLPTASGLEYFGAVRTGVAFEDNLHPHWQQAITNTLSLNLAVRREVHEFIQGFPEEAVFRQFRYGTEDQAYNTWLQQFCHLARVDRPTVDYLRYPGSHFDRQLQKFQSPPGTCPDTLSPEEQQQQAAIAEIIQSRLQALSRKLGCS